MKRPVIIALFLVFTLALFFRFWNLSKYPEAIDEDEMALGYNAYSLLHGGTDEWGHKLPIYFESNGDYKYGLYSYFDTVPVALFGLNIFSTRFIAALSGSILVVVIFFVVRELSKNDGLSLISSFVLAVSPTFVHFSRVGYNNVFGALLSIVSLLYYLKWIKKLKSRYLILFATFLILSIYSYQADRIFMPISIAAISFIYFLNANAKLRLKLFLVCLSSIILIFSSFISPESRTRSQDFSLLTNIPKLTEESSEDNIAGVRLITTRIFHNKVLSAALGISNRYFSYFDPVYLFSSISNGSSRHSIPNIGFLYLVDAPFLFIGLLYFFKYFKDENGWVLLSILLASPAAASLVIEPRSNIRSVVLAIPLTIIVAVGIYHLFMIKNLGRYLAAAIAFIYLANVVFFVHEYTVHKTYHQPWYTDYGLEQMVNDVNKFQDNYSAVVMSHAHYMPYLFFNKVIPQDFVLNSDFYDSPPAGLVRVKRFGKIYFSMPYDCPSAGKKGVLYVCFGTTVPRFTNVIDVIRYKDSLPSIFLIEFTGKQSVVSLPSRLTYADINAKFPIGLLPDSYPTFWP